MIPWHIMGLRESSFPQIAGRYTGLNCLVVAGGRCVWEDCEQVPITAYDIMCVNDVVMHWPGPIEHFYSNDWVWAPKWIAARRPRYQKDFGEIEHTHSCNNDHLRWNWPWPGHGTSTLNAVYTALGLGYDKVVVAGAPLDNSGHYFDPPWVKTNFENEVATRPDATHPNGQLRYWSGAHKIFSGKVRAISGRYAEWAKDAPSYKNP